MSKKSKLLSVIMSGILVITSVAVVFADAEPDEAQNNAVLNNAELATYQIESVTLDASSITLAKGASRQLVATVTPASEPDAVDAATLEEAATDAATLTTDNPVAWASSNANVASVDENGLVVARRVGTAVISCTSTEDTSKIATCTVNVGLSKNSSTFFAHRGDTSVAAENTLPAFAAAASEGFYGIEMDVWAAKGNYLVVSHSKKVNGKKITKMSAKNRGQYTVGGYAVPTLQEVMNTIWSINPNCVIELDIKQSNISNGAVKKIIKMCGSRRVNICSYSKTALKKFKKYRKSGNMVLVGCTSQVTQAKRTKWIKTAKSLGCSMVAFSSYYITESDIYNCHARGMQCRVRWSSDPVSIEANQDRGIDAFIVGTKVWVD